MSMDERSAGLAEPRSEMREQAYGNHVAVASMPSQSENTCLLFNGNEPFVARGRLVPYAAHAVLKAQSGVDSR